MFILKQTSNIAIFSLKIYFPYYVWNIKIEWFCAWIFISWHFHVCIIITVVIWITHSVVCYQGSAKSNFLPIFFIFNFFSYKTLRKFKNLIEEKNIKSPFMHKQLS